MGFGTYVSNGTGHPRIVHLVQVHYHVGFYQPASYTDVVGSRHGGQRSAWGSCNCPGLPRRLISPAGLLHLVSS